jgi:tripartite-type tricarboxylate transporter receptor subunit TctC
MFKAAALVAIVMTSAAAGADASQYPNRPVRLIVSFPAGGAMDSLARMIAPELSNALGQAVVIENRPGATGSIGTEVAAKAPPDGHTLLIASSVAANNPAIAASAFDLTSDFLPITRLVNLPIVIAATRYLNVSTLAELIALARREPGKLAYATNGIGTASHLAALMLTRRASISLVHIPYGGTRSFSTDVISGEMPLVFASSGSLAALIGNGQVTALAVTGGERVAAFPGLPTVAESGFPGFEMMSWYGVFAPAGTPADRVERLYREFVRILQMPKVRDGLGALGMVPSGSTPAQFTAELKADGARWVKLMREAASPVD